MQPSFWICLERVHTLKLKSLPRQTIARRRGVVMKSKLPRSVATTLLFAISLCALKLFKVHLLCLSPHSLTPQMASRLSHIVMLQCVNRRNYNWCVDTLLTSICGNEKEKAETEEVLFPLFWGRIDELVKNGRGLGGKMFRIRFLSVCGRMRVSEMWNKRKRTFLYFKEMVVL